MKLIFVVADITLLNINIVYSQNQISKSLLKGACFRFCIVPYKQILSFNMTFQAYFQSIYIRKEYIKKSVQKDKTFYDEVKGGSRVPDVLRNI